MAMHMSAYAITKNGSYAKPETVNADGIVTKDEYLVYFATPPAHVHYVPRADDKDEVMPTEPKWSGAMPVPALGTFVHVAMNGIGRAAVCGYFVEHGFLGLYVAPVDPPAWYVKQNGRGPCHVFGVEVTADKPRRARRVR